MIVLYESPAGLALFKVLNESKLATASDLHAEFATPKKASEMVQLLAFNKFNNTAEALSSATAIAEGSISKEFKSFLKSHLKNSKETLLVADPKLATSIAKKFEIKVASDSSTLELMRGIRSQINSLLGGVSESDINAMSLGLSHSLSRYKIKFSPDKVDTMIVQAIMLLDDLDKEVNTYAMRMKEWYGWHFPELTKILVDNVAYAKTIKFMGMRQNALELDFKEILPEDIEIELKEALKISMGTEISEEDMENIKMLADQVITISEYRTELFEYLKNRMMAIAPNLTALVGELVGARLIANAGSLMNLAKHPASTVQILGAEKALFRALKTKHNTPKYGLIYHATLIGQAAPKLKGKISRVLAAKAALSVRVDALGENTDASIGTEHRAAVEDRLRQLENQARNATSGSFRGKANVGRQNMNAGKSYNSSNDFKFDNSKKRPAESEPVEVKKPKIEVIEPKTEESPKAEEKKKEKKDKKEKKEKKDKKDKKEKKEKKEKKDKS